MPITSHLKSDLLTITNSKSITNIQLIQGVWGGYGQLLRVSFFGGSVSSVVVKLVNKPQPSTHPKGWNTNLSHQRKLFSYQVESNWYTQYGHLHHHLACYIPRCLLVGKNDTQQWLILEDLCASGFPIIKKNCSLAEAKTCISWLAQFHVLHLQRKPQGLWITGSYWHLETRPDELENLQDTHLKATAYKLDNILSSSPFQTLIHGDAKLTNFCFSEACDKVAAVDFQYIGQGCGMKDLVLFISSAVTPALCELHAPLLVDHYFSVLTEATITTPFDGEQLESSWRPLYGIAWADFHRFIKGWSPEHWKINNYTESLTQQALTGLDTFKHQQFN